MMGVVLWIPFRSIKTGSSSFFKHPIRTSSLSSSSSSEKIPYEWNLNKTTDDSVSSSSSSSSVCCIVLYLEDPSTLDLVTKPLPPRSTSADRLRKRVFPYPHHSFHCSKTNSMNPYLPIHTFPDEDPWLPWIHDYFTTANAESVTIIAQNKRRCQTGKGQENIMKHWEPQMALLQPIPVRREEQEKMTRSKHPTTIFRLSSPDNATAKETRFLCHFHSDDDTIISTTLSQYLFNYEYVLWRKRKLPMYQTTGKDNSKFELSQLVFSCPVPESLRQYIWSSSDSTRLKLDIVPIRTSVRSEEKVLFTINHTGPDEFQNLMNKDMIFPTLEYFGTDHILPAVQDSGRYANLPLCPPLPQLQKQQDQHYFHFVGCTWTSASYRRRGDSTIINDSAKRLKEWIHFHKLVGMDHIFVFDNTQGLQNGEVSPIESITDEFPDFVTYIEWPATVCSNNRPNHKNPGERSSQYAVDAVCRNKYGPLTEWMAFIDTDEYLVPMRKNETWHGILRDMERRNIDVLKMPSSRGRPRIQYMDQIIEDDPNICESPTKQKNKLPREPCVGPRQNETFLRVYNCDYIKHPRPERFSRAMKQIYRPAHVLSHFVHYSTVTADIARYYIDDPKIFQRTVRESEFHDVFLNELTEGTLIHAKTVLPYETVSRTAVCINASKYTCPVGHECPSGVDFDDSIHKNNLFHDENGKYCNCWVDEHVETFWIPLLEKALAEKEN
jgi:hypothetical protein